MPCFAVEGSWKRDVKVGNKGKGKGGGNALRFLGGCGVGEQSRGEFAGLTISGRYYEGTPLMKLNVHTGRGLNT